MLTVMGIGDKCKLLFALLTLQVDIDLETGSTTNNIDGVAQN